MSNSPPLRCRELMHLTGQDKIQTGSTGSRKSVRNTWLYLFLLLTVLASIVSQTCFAAITNYSIFMQTRYGHTSTVLGDGRVLVTGGMNQSGYLASAEIFTQQPTPISAPAASMDIPRRYHTATELPNGNILIVGGETAVGTLTKTARIYDRKLGTWATAADMVTPRARHAATLLGDGRVLVTGGGIGDQGLASAEVYDWQTNTWSSAGSFAGVRYFHSATLLYNGKVLVAGGGLFQSGTVSALASASLYDPVANSWTALPNMITSRYQHGAVAMGNGKVLMVSGRNGSWNTSAVEVFDPFANTWSAVANLQQARSAFAQLLLSDGRVMVSGGWTPNTADNTVTQVEIYEPRYDTWSSVGDAQGRQLHTMNLLGNGDVVIWGGVTGTNIYRGTQRVEYAARPALFYGTVPPTWTGLVNYLSPGWTGTYGATALVMPNGNIAVAGGHAVGSAYFVLSETGQRIYDGKFSPDYYTYSLIDPTLTLLKDGRLLMSGGGAGDSSRPVGWCELYPGFSGNTLMTNTTTIFMKAYRRGNQAILLKNGKVFSIGGNSEANSPLTEIFDPATNSWTATGPNLSGIFPSALLADGRVLVTGDAFARIYDPYANTWTTVPNLTSSKKLVALPNGKVLAAGGSSLTAELFDPDTQTWSNAGTMTSSQSGSNTALLPNGNVLFAASSGLDLFTTIYRSATNDWIAGPLLNSSRLSASYTTMKNGKLILTDGPYASQGNSEIFNLNYDY